MKKLVLTLGVLLTLAIPMTSFADNISNLENKDTVQTSQQAVSKAKGPEAWDKVADNYGYYLAVKPVTVYRGPDVNSEVLGELPAGACFHACKGPQDGFIEFYQFTKNKSASKMGIWANTNASYNLSGRNAYVLTENLRQMREVKGNK